MGTPHQGSLYCGFSSYIVLDEHSRFFDVGNPGGLMLGGAMVFPHVVVLQIRISSFFYFKFPFLDIVMTSPCFPMIQGDCVGGI